MINVKLGQSIAECVQETRNHLEKATEDLNTALMAAETALASLRLGVRASVEIDLKDFDDFDIHCLGFGKLNGQWKLFHEFQVNGEYTVEPLLNCNREIRLAAVNELATLFNALIDTAKVQADFVSTKATEAADFVEFIKAHSNSGLVKT